MFSGVGGDPPSLSLRCHPWCVCIRPATVILDCPSCDSVPTAGALIWWEKWKREPEPHPPPPTPPPRGVRCVPFDWISLRSAGHYKQPLGNEHAGFDGFLLLCALSCACRMGLPEDSDDGASQYEQRGEGAGGESQTESQVSKPQLPVGRKKRKSRKRYHSKLKTPRGNVLLFYSCLFPRPITSQWTSSIWVVVVFLLFSAVCSDAVVCPSLCLCFLPDDCGSTSPTANMKVVCAGGRLGES